MEFVNLLLVRKNRNAPFDVLEAPYCLCGVGDMVDTMCKGCEIHGLIVEDVISAVKGSHEYNFIKSLGCRDSAEFPRVTRVWREVSVE